MYPIYEFGSEDQKRRWLPELAGGRAIGCFGLTEPDYGSNPAGMITVAKAAKEREERGTDSPVGLKILEQLGYASWQELQERANAQPDQVFPIVFPIVAAAADAGDPTAREILFQAADQLSCLVSAVAEHSSMGRENFRIVKTGGTVGRCAFLDAQLDAALKRVLPAAQIGGLRMSPAEAAARAART